MRPIGTELHASPVPEGTLIDYKYRVERVLGGGGMGVLVAAHHEKLGRPVAIKFLRADLCNQTQAIERFTREARAAVRIQSEHVAQVLDVGTLPSGTPYIVMQYLEGRDLSAELKSRGRLTSEEAAGYVLQAADAVAQAHALGIVHRDLKPANLFLCSGADGEPLVKVLDFGISKSLGQTITQADLTASSQLIGSPLYMSPEQLADPTAVDERTDLWSLGVILYELLIGKPPFAADTVPALYAQLVSKEIELGSSLAGFPRALADTIESCLEPDVTQRMPNVARLARALGPFAPMAVRPLVSRIDRILSQRPDGGVFDSTERALALPEGATPSNFGGPAMDGRSLRTRIWGALLVFLLLVGVGAWGFVEGRASELGASDSRSPAVSPPPVVPPGTGMLGVSPPREGRAAAESVVVAPEASTLDRARRPPARAGARVRPPEASGSSRDVLDGRK